MKNRFANVIENVLCLYIIRIMYYNYMGIYNVKVNICFSYIFHIFFKYFSYIYIYVSNISKFEN